MSVEGTDWVELAHLGALSNPDEWLLKARNLKKASEVFVSQLEAYWNTTGKKRKDLEPFYHAYLMLMAFSIENLAKGLILQKANPTEFMKQYADRSLFRKGGLLASHDLMSLLGKTGMLKHMDSGFLDILNRLSNIAVWEGRYPTPTGHDKLDPALCDAKYVPLSVFGSSDLSNITKLWSFLESELAALIESSSMVNEPPAS